MNNDNLSISSSFVLVIFGATGDLTQRKLLPALFHLFKKKLLPEHFFIVAFSRRPYSSTDFQEFAEGALKKYALKDAFDANAWKEFSGKFYYQQGEFESIEGYKKLIDKLKEIDQFINACVPRYAFARMTNYCLQTFSLSVSSLTRGLFYISILKRLDLKVLLSRYLFCILTPPQANLSQPTSDYLLMR